MHTNEDVEKYLFSKLRKVSCFEDIENRSYIQIYWIKDIEHCIATFPRSPTSTLSDNYIFNCNPRDYPLDILSSNEMTIGFDSFKSTQVEPTLLEYQKYWELAEKEERFNTMLENERNCVFWTCYYVYWYKTFGFSHNFPHTLNDLENWCQKVIKNEIDIDLIFKD